MAAALLRNISFLSSLSHRYLARIYCLGKVLHLCAGKTIFAKAQAGQHMFIVLSGRIKIFAQSNSKKRKTFAYLGKGEFFGEMALLDGKARSASAQAVEDSRVLLIPKNEFKRLLLSDPKLNYYMLRAVADRLRRANEEIENLVFSKMVNRLSRTLHDLAMNSGKSFRGGRLLNSRYSHQDLADLVGTTREPMTRALSSLKRANLLEFRHNRYFIPNPQKLNVLSFSS